MTQATQPGKPPANAAEAPKTNAPPGDGWDDAGRPDVDGWLKAVEGLVIYGKVVGFFGYKVFDKQTQAMKNREAICVKVIGDGTVAQLKGGASVTLKQGQVIALSMMHLLEGARPYLSGFQEGSTYLWCKFDKKVPIGGGQSVWKGQLKMKGPKGQSVSASPAGTTEQGSDDGNAPVEDDGVPF